MTILLPVIVGAVLLGVAKSVPVEYYATKYDHLDIDTILNNRRMVNYYAACMLGRGPCPPEGIEFKRILPEALTTNCEKCTEKQKAVIIRTVKRLKKEYPKVWKQLADLWDPDETAIKKFEATYSGMKYPVGTTTSPPTVNLVNRFGDSENEGSNVIPSSTIVPVTKPSTTRTTTTKKTTPQPPPSTTNKPFTNNNSLNSVTKIPTRAPPITTVGANIDATVSFGTNVVGGLVRSIGTIGSRVVETGAQLAGVAFKTLQAVVGNN